MTTMDTNDTTPTEEQGEPITDLLINMFIRQAGHRVQYDEIYRRRGLNPPAQGQWGNLNNPDVQAAIRETLAYCVEEAYEAIGLLKNKPWKQSFVATDIDAFYKEFADAWHFWLEANILAGMTPDIIAKYYFDMAQKNDERRENGY